MLGVCQYAALVKFYPYDLTLGLTNYQFDLMDGGGWAAYWNSIEMASWTAVFGIVVVFLGAYLVEKGRGFNVGRGVFQFLAMMPMAVPGLVLGLAYIFFFNAPDNPLNGLYHTMAILVISTIVHFYTVAHLTAVTALKQMDAEFESVAASLKAPFYKTLWRVTVPVCLPAILDIGIYLFVNAMTTVSGGGVHLRAGYGAGLGGGAEHGRRRRHRPGGGHGHDDLPNPDFSRQCERCTDPAVAICGRAGRSLKETHHDNRNSQIL